MNQYQQLIAKRMEDIAQGKRLIVLHRGRWKTLNQQMNEVIEYEKLNSNNISISFDEWSYE